RELGQGVQRLDHRQGRHRGVRTAVVVLRGPLKDRRSWISGNLEDRVARGITKALCHAGDDVELVATRLLAVDAQLELQLERNLAVVSRVRDSAEQGTQPWLNRPASAASRTARASPA